MEKELIDFLKYVKEVHVDGYGHLEICDSGDELDPTVEKVVKDYLKSKEMQSGGGIGRRLNGILCYRTSMKTISSIFKLQVRILS